MNRKMIVYKENIFTRIKEFFMNIFNKNKQINKIENLEEKNVLNNENNFKDTIMVQQDTEEQQLLKLQREYKQGKIKEEDMTDNEHQSLIELYKKQNNDLKGKIDIKRQVLRKKLNDIKV